MKSLRNFMKRLWSNRYMIKSMVVRDIKARYVGSALGLIWTVIQPLATLAVYYFVFSYILKVRIGTSGEINFAMWLMAGLLPWMFFAETLSRSSNVLLDNASLITKTNFNSEILPVVLLGSNFVNHLIAMLLLFLIGIPLKLFSFELSMLRIPIYMFFTMYFVLGLSWIISALNIFLRDIGQLIGVILNVWFYATPIVYPANQVPEAVLKIIKLNPLYFIVEGYRGAIFNYSTIDWFGIKYLFIVGTVFFILGGVIFKRLKKDFGDVL